MHFSDTNQAKGQANLPKPSTKQAPSQSQLINQRKNEYRKIENESSELIVNSIGAYIGKSNKGIVVKCKGQVINKGVGLYDTLP